MAADPLELYAGSAQRYDELLDRDGAVRPPWRRFVEHLSTGGIDSLRRGVELSRRLVTENGVTYNVYADPQGRDRPWLLDPLPLLLSVAEWQEIEAGVIQRTQLFNALLQDLYGPQRLLNSGIVPPELAFAHPNFLWAAHGVRPLRDVWLHVHAVDLARAPDGRWWALGDRTQTPSGLGYALENRQIVARVYPGLINELAVRALGEFPNAMREALAELADDATPLAVVLTPGPFNETYFEHAYLARQLGMPLVQGQDLTVRADTVYLKTFAGLQRVHAILRRLDDDFCDPLELRADSALGIPGLLGAVRAGRVALANALGSGVLESPAWQGFLPGIAAKLGGTALRMPTVATWWCGERPALEYVLANLERLVVKTTFPNQSFEPAFGRHLSSAERSELKERLRSRPYAYVAQERLLLSHAPAWRSGTRSRLTPRALSLRVYAVWTPQGYRVLPGGLARIAAEGVRDIVSSQRGGGSKDVWVLSERQQPSAAVESPPAARPARQADLPSQLIENLYWLGRYSERCEDKTRLVRATLTVRSDHQTWRTALDTCVHFGVLDPAADASVSLYDERLEQGLATDLGRFGWSATQARSRLSAAHWRSVSLMQRQFHEAGQSRSEPVETLDRLLVSLTALSGFALDDMTQDDGWRMLMLGRRLERVQFLAELLTRVLLEPSPLGATLGWLLDVCSSSITYRTRYLAAPRLGSVIQLLVYEQSNPRSLAFQWHKILRTLQDLSAPLGTEAEDLLRTPVAALREFDGENLDAAPAAAAELARLLQGLAAGADQLAELLAMRHFTHSERDLRTVAT
jgi:uncharacterized circularly permuted ATP-grasp superfamily protein/uncharacterized alpha-E superfamily protein